MVMAWLAARVRNRPMRLRGSCARAVGGLLDDRQIAEDDSDQRIEALIQAIADGDGGGYTNGTKVIGWYKDSDGNENFYGVPLTSWCNSGYVTETCPFTVGSGLNARYNGDAIVSLDTSNNQCVGADSSWSAAVLGGCVPNGGAFVESNVNGAFLISVGVSNHWYNALGSYDVPYWLVWDGVLGGQLAFVGQAINSWACDPSGNSAVCGKL